MNQQDRGIPLVCWRCWWREGRWCYSENAVFTGEKSPETRGREITAEHFELCRAGRAFLSKRGIWDSVLPTGAVTITSEERLRAKGRPSGGECVCCGTVTATASLSCAEPPQPPVDLWQVSLDLVCELQTIAVAGGQNIHRPLAVALRAGLERSLVFALARRAWRVTGRDQEILLDCGHELEALAVMEVGSCCRACLEILSECDAGGAL